jgi:lipopolysaccharide assembly protein A
MRRLAWLIGLLPILAAVVFAVANRQTVTLDLWPLPWSLDLPAYLAVLGPLGLGIIIGAVLAGAAGLKARFRAASLSRRLRQ